MRVLLIESDAGAGQRADAELRAAGHEVVTCHQRGSPTFPCVGIAGDGACPLTEPGVSGSTGAVDVAVVVRAHPWPRPTPREQGVTCALREGVPLVVSGHTALNPYEDWAAAVVHGGGAEVVAALDRWSAGRA